MKEKAIHHKSDPGSVECNAERRWGFYTLLKARSWLHVTCINCLRKRDIEQMKLSDLIRELQGHLSIFGDDEVYFQAA